MSRRNALPCIVCDRQIESMDDSYINSPYGATAFETQGHYGSTIFDPMNGTYLELNVCDSCLRRLASEEKILLGQTRKRVMTNTRIGGGDEIPLFVGWLAVKREMTTWHPGTEDDDDVFISLDDVGNSDLYPEIAWHETAVEYARDLLSRENGQ
jgi:hypothetical protein